jgi:DNA adenine methylase
MNNDPALIKWFGGKGKLKDWVKTYVPYNHIYCELYGGAASLLFARALSPVEVYNDIEKELVNLFRVLQEPKSFVELQHRIDHTLYSRDEYRKALQIYWNSKTYQSKVLRAWAFYVVCNQSYSGKGYNSKASGNWGRALYENVAGMAHTTSSWIARGKALKDFADRAKRVQIENQPASYVISSYDTPKTVFYVDPPYHLSTRQGKQYNAELSNIDYESLISQLLNCKGAVTLSGYNCEIYERLEAAGWQRYDREVVASSAGRNRGSKLRGLGSGKFAQRTESLWVNPKAQQLLKPQPTLFD